MTQNKQSISLNKQNVVTFTNTADPLTLQVTPMSAGVLLKSMTDEVTQDYLYPVTPIELSTLKNSQQVLDKIIPISKPVLSGFSKKDAINNLDELFRKASMLPYIKMKGILVEMINEGDVTTQEDYNYYVDSCIELSHYDMPDDLVGKIKSAGIGNQSDLVKATAQLLVDTVDKLNEHKMFDLYSQDSTAIDNQVH